MTQSSPTPAGASALLIHSEGTGLVSIELDREIQIGRDVPTGVSIPDASLSRVHARIWRDPDGIWIEDLASTNGTWVNQVRVGKCRVSAKDEIKLGGARLVVCHSIGTPLGPSTGVIVAGPKLERVFELAGRAAPSDVPILISGETGAGKDVVALAVHAASHRKAGPVVVLSCSALPASVLGTALLGHEPGGIAGAQTTRLGAFERAQGGTLILDEVGDLSTDAQASVLRALETRRVVRLGGSEEHEIDVRLISTTQRDLRSLVARGEFRGDLFYRINGFAIHVPPLRERREEIGPLASAFLSEATRLHAKSLRGFDPSAENVLKKAVWMGNVRELRSAVHRGALAANGPLVYVDDLPEDLRAREAPPPDEDLTMRPGDTARPIPEPVEESMDDTYRGRLQRYEAAQIRRALEEEGWNVARAAGRLRMPYRTLTGKMKTFGLKRGVR